MINALCQQMCDYMDTLHWSYLFIYLFIISSSLTHLALITCGYDLTQSIYLTVESVLHSISINPFYLQDDLGRRLMRAGLKCIPQ